MTTVQFVKINQYSLAEVAKMLGVRYYRIKYAETMGYVPQPATIYGRFKYYTDADVEVLRRYFAAKESIS